MPGAADIRRSRRSLAAEGGFAMPTVMLLLLAAFSVASIAAVASISAQSGTARDLGSKSALAAAEAGAQQALVRYNAAAANGTCVSPQTLQADGWCTAATGAPFSGGVFTYWVAPGNGVIDVVSQGAVGGVTRRIHLTAHSAAGSQPFNDAAIIGRDSISLASNSDITGDTKTNGDINLAGSSSVFICGNAQVGVGHDILPPGTSAHTCGVETQGSFTLPPANQADVRTENDNSRFFALNPSTGKKQDVCWNGADAAGAASSLCGPRELFIGTNSAVTMTTGNYSFCKLTLRQNSALAVASGSTVRVYFDSPEACGAASPAVQLDMNSNSSITANGVSGATDVAFLFVGSESRASQITLASNTLQNQACNQNFVVYAPRTDVIMASNSSYCGAIAGKTIQLSANAHVSANNLAQNWNLPNAPSHYAIDRFVECPAQDTSGGC